MAITTAGYDRHSICWEQHDYMLKVLDGSIETDAADNWKPSKKKSVERIDGIVALIMGLDRASTQDVCTSVYEKHGLRSL
nr:terminase TerL endonuclease subunit [Symmachiella dynata]